MLDVYATSSVDAGLTWTADLKINTTAFDPDAGAPERFPGVTRIGEYNGVAIIDGIAHADWTGNTFSGSTPIGQQATYGKFSTIVLSPPGNVSATDGSSSKVTVSWTDVSGEIGYKIYRNGGPTPIGTVGANATSFDDLSPPATINTYCVRAYDNFSQSDQACDTGYPQPLPLVATISGPTWLSADQAGTWTVSYTGGIGPYTIQWSKYRDCPGAVPFNAQLASSGLRNPDQPDAPPVPGAAPLGVDAVTCYIWVVIGSGGTSVSASDPYDFYIRAVVTDALGATGTAQRNVDIPGVQGSPLPAPAGVSATDGTVPGVVVSWSQVLGAEGYRVYRNGALLATLGQNTFTYTHVNAPAVLATYCVEAYSGSIVSTRPCDTGYPQTAPVTASVSGPTTLSANQVGTWTVSGSGGIGPYTYKWAKYRNCPGTPAPSPQRGATPLSVEAVTCWVWVYSTNTTTSYSTSDPYDFWVRATVTDAVGQVANRTVCVNIPSVTGRDPCPGPMPFVADEDRNALPSSLAGALVTKLGTVYPNPGRESTTLEFSLASAMHVTLVVYDVAGREVATIVDQYMAGGVHSVAWDARGMRSGLYLGRLKAGDVVATRRFMIVR
jgi:hypothetical protein